MAPPTHQGKEIYLLKEILQLSVRLDFMQCFVVFPSTVFMMLTIGSPSDINTGRMKKKQNEIIRV